MASRQDKALKAWKALAPAARKGKTRADFLARSVAAQKAAAARKVAEKARAERLALDAARKARARAREAKAREAAEQASKRHKPAAGPRKPRKPGKPVKPVKPSPPVKPAAKPRGPGILYEAVAEQRWRSLPSKQRKGKSRADFIAKSAAARRGASAHKAREAWKRLGPKQKAGRTLAEFTDNWLSTGGLSEAPLPAGTWEKVGEVKGHELFRTADARGTDNLLSTFDDGSFYASVLIETSEGRRWASVHARDKSLADGEGFAEELSELSAGYGRDAQIVAQTTVIRVRGFKPDDEEGGAGSGAKRPRKPGPKAPKRSKRRKVAASK